MRYLKSPFMKMERKHGSQVNSQRPTYRQATLPVEQRGVAEKRAGLTGGGDMIHSFGGKLERRMLNGSS
jgi:hypothetical protein